jgi:DNA uptake protein ComE-like DNA-binding protein
MKTLIRLIALCFAFAIAAAPVAVHAQDKTSPAKAEKSTKTKAAPKVDINSATAEQLMKLPDVDAETADRIIASRPYSSKAQLKNKNILTEAAYNKITDQIIARQPKKDGDAAKGDGKEKGKGKGKAKDKAAK